jgi:hypothetical protein
MSAARCLCDCSGIAASAETKRKRALSLSRMDVDAHEVRLRSAEDEFVPSRYGFQ